MALPANKKNIKIYWDMDNVLADFEGFLDTHDIDYNHQGEPIDPEKDIKMWDYIRNNHPHFFKELKPIPKSIELFKTLNKEYDCEILTGRPKDKWNIPNADNDKREWIKEHLGEDIKVNVTYSYEKQKFVEGKQSVLIDDFYKNIDRWNEAGGTGILYDKNKEFDHSKINNIEKTDIYDELLNKAKGSKIIGKNFNKYCQIDNIQPQKTAEAEL